MTTNDQYMWKHIPNKNCKWCLGRGTITIVNQGNQKNNVKCGCVKTVKVEKENNNEKSTT